jgi:hypothetical protein
MPSYNFQSRFAAAVEAGRKTQTIRAPRKDGRVPQPGQTAYLYTGMRSSACRKLGEGVITHVADIRISHMGVTISSSSSVRVLRKVETLDAFAQADGFVNWQEMVDWFQTTHGMPFVGHLIVWEML